jgi:YD repeat-containing protein
MTTRPPRRNLTTIDTPINGNAAMGYDAAGRLNSYKDPQDTATLTYVLDDAGNVTSDGDSTFSFSSNRLVTRNSGGVAFNQTYSDVGDHKTESGTARRPPMDTMRHPCRLQSR